mgnify:CR=1 FL=1
MRGLLANVPKASDYLFHTQVFKILQVSRMWMTCLNTQFQNITYYQFQSKISGDDLLCEKDYKHKLKTGNQYWLWRFEQSDKFVMPLIQLLVGEMLVRVTKSLEFYSCF